MENKNKKQKPAKILLDVPVDDGVLGFDNYRDALVNIIKGSDPRFTIGIFGGWGTGKTTLMRMMKKKLDDEGEVTVWFNPWQFERERHLMVPLLQTLKLELETNYKDQVEEGILNKLGNIAVSFAKSFKPEINLGITKISFDAEKFIEKGDEKKDFASLYFALHQELQKIIENIESDRIVIFVDDLDRCLPDRALQVLESVKLFLDAEGYVFVLGLDRNIIEKCVNKKYSKESGISGTDYIKKMIQVPFNLPGLREQEVKDYVEQLKDKLKGTEIEKHVKKYIKIISKGMEANPREIKRFINNFILVNQISAGETEPDKLLVLLIIYFRWEELYDTIVAYKKDFLDKLKFYMENKKKINIEDEKDVKAFKETCGVNYEFFTKMEGHPLYSFLKSKEGKALFEIDDLDPYIHFSRAATIPEPEKPKILKKEELISLLKSGRIEEFNKIRPHPYVNLIGANLRRAELIRAVLIRAVLRGADLSEANLRGADLRGADLSGAKLSGANLSGANLRGADLRIADLREADLRGADLGGANLSGADLSGADLIRAELRGAGLRGVDLSGAKLSGADLSEANLIEANLRGADLRGADLGGADLGGADLSAIKINEDTIFYKTIIQNVKNLSKKIRDTLHIEEEDGVEMATSKRPLERKVKSKSSGMNPDATKEKS